MLLYFHSGHEAQFVIWRESHGVTKPPKTLLQGLLKTDHGSYLHLEAIHECEIYAPSETWTFSFHVCNDVNSLIL